MFLVDKNHVAYGSYFEHIWKGYRECVMSALCYSVRGLTLIPQTWTLNFLVCIHVMLVGTSLTDLARLCSVNAPLYVFPASYSAGSSIPERYQWFLPSRV